MFPSGGGRGSPNGGAGDGGPPTAPGSLGERRAPQSSPAEVDGGLMDRKRWADPGGLALGAKARRTDKVAIPRDDVGVRRLPREQRSAIGPNSPATLPSRVDDRSPQGRKRTIMARYVFGDELKPGERREVATPHVAMKRGSARRSWRSISDPSRRKPSRSALTFKRRLRRPWRKIAVMV